MAGMEVVNCPKCGNPMRRTGADKEKGKLFKLYECLTCGHKLKKRM